MTLRRIMGRLVDDLPSRRYDETTFDVAYRLFRQEYQHAYDEESRDAVCQQDLEQAHDEATRRALEAVFVFLERQG